MFREGGAGAAGLDFRGWTFFAGCCCGSGGGTGGAPATEAGPAGIDGTAVAEAASGDPSKGSGCMTPLAPGTGGSSTVRPAVCHRTEVARTTSATTTNIRRSQTRAGHSGRSK